MNKDHLINKNPNTGPRIFDLGNPTNDNCGDNLREWCLTYKPWMLKEHPTYQIMQEIKEIHPEWDQTQCEYCLVDFLKTPIGQKYLNLITATRV